MSKYQKKTKMDVQTFKWFIELIAFQSTIPSFKSIGQFSSSRINVGDEFLHIFHISY